MRRFVVPALWLLAFALQAEPAWTQVADKSESSSAARSIDPDESLFHREPLPDGPVALIGGTVEELDRLRNRLKVKATGGGTKTITFDERTSVLRDGQAVTYDKIRKGDRVHVDTILYQQKVFARGVRIHTQAAAAGARGQVTAYDPGTGTIMLLDELSGVPVEFRVDSSTQIRSGEAAGRAADLIPGTLVTVQFLSEAEAMGTAREITILAKPGTDFVFAGAITNIDLRSNVFSVANKSDEKTYDLLFDPAQVQDLQQLKIGSEVVVSAVFSGKGYHVRKVDILASQGAR